VNSCGQSLTRHSDHFHREDGLRQQAGVLEGVDLGRGAAVASAAVVMEVTPPACSTVTPTSMTRRSG
jgi:hypothetical protein